MSHNRIRQYLEPVSAQPQAISAAPRNRILQYLAPSPSAPLAAPTALSASGFVAYPEALLAELSPEQRAEQVRLFQLAYQRAAAEIRAEN